MLRNIDELADLQSMAKDRGLTLYEENISGKTDGWFYSMRDENNDYLGSFYNRSEVLCFFDGYDYGIKNGLDK